MAESTLSSIICLFTFAIILVAAIPAPPREEIPEVLQNLYEQDLDAWKPPSEMQKNLPYYLSGYDYEDRPVWVMEFGKYDIRGHVTGNEDRAKALDKYSDQLVWNILQSADNATDPENPKDVVIIMDMDGYSLEQLGSTQAFAFVLKFLKIVVGVFKYVDAVYVINANFVANNLINLVKPIMGPEFTKVEVYGTNADKWLPILLKKIPPSQLPPWYGGSKDFRPVRVYG